MNCYNCDKPLTGGLDTFGLVNEELCWDCYATRNAEAGEPVYGLGPHVHDLDPETGAMTTTFLDQSLTDDFMPDPDAPGLGVWMPPALPGWR
jgi:hypothetical protein